MAGRGSQQRNANDGQQTPRRRGGKARPSRGQQRGRSSTHTWVVDVQPLGR